MAKTSLLEFAAGARRRSERSAVLVVCSAVLFSGGVVIAAEAGSPAAALAVARSFLGREFTVNDSPTLTPDDKAMIHAKRGQRACSLTLVRRASVLSGWKISAQDCKPKTSKGAKLG